MKLEPVIVGLGWFPGLDPEVRRAKMDAYFTKEYGLCGCGKPVRYIVPNSDEAGACNKYARCPTYDELKERLEAAIKADSTGESMSEEQAAKIDLTEHRALGISGRKVIVRDPLEWQHGAKDSEEMRVALEQIAALAHHGGLIGFSDVDNCLREVRRISLKWRDKSECARLQAGIDAVPPGFSGGSL